MVNLTTINDINAAPVKKTRYRICCNRFKKPKSSLLCSPYQEQKITSSNLVYSGHLVYFRGNNFYYYSPNSGYNHNLQRKFYNASKNAKR